MGRKNAAAAEKIRQASLAVAAQNSQTVHHTVSKTPATALPAMIADSKRPVDIWLQTVSCLFVIGIVYYVCVGRRYGATRQFLASTYLALGHIVTCLIYKSEKVSPPEYFLFTFLMSLGAISFVY